MADDICLAWLLESTLFERGWDEPFEGEIIGVKVRACGPAVGSMGIGYITAAVTAANSTTSPTPTSTRRLSFISGPHS